MTAVNFRGSAERARNALEPRGSIASQVRRPDRTARPCHGKAAARATCALGAHRRTRRLGPAVADASSQLPVESDAPAASPYGIDKAGSLAAKPDSPCPTSSDAWRTRTKRSKRRAGGWRGAALIVVESNRTGILQRNSGPHECSSAVKSVLAHPHASFDCSKKKRSLKDCAQDPPKEEVLEDASDWHPTCGQYARAKQVPQAFCCFAAAAIRSRIAK